MSLSKQLGLSFLIVLLLVFAGTLWVNVSNTRAFIETQLQSHAQDTATSLGLSITPYIDSPEDLPIIDTMTNAIFDRGYYQQIILRDVNDAVLLDKQNPVELASVPAWFTRWFALPAPTSSTELNTGWNMAGTLSVTSNPGFGYEQLWGNAVDTFWLVLFIFALALGFVWMLVRLITKPLLAVVSQADAISHRHFEQVHPIPKTPELRVFVKAINAMSSKLADMFEHITQQSDEYRAFAYTDTLTKDGNRRSFTITLSHLLNDEEEQPEGFVILVRLSSLAHVNQHEGAAAGDDYVTTLCAAMHKTCLLQDVQYLQYRLSGADFAIIVQHISQDKLQSLVGRLSEVFLSLEKSEYVDGTACIGVSSFAYKDAYAQVMESADSALVAASALPSQVQFANQLPLTQSASEWREQIQQIISTGEANFAAQAIVADSGTLLYHEWFARITHAETQEPVPMAQLIPASMRLDYAIELDKMIIANALERLSSSDQKIGINVSRMALIDPSFQTWLLMQIPNRRRSSSRLVIEIPERAVVNAAHEILDFVHALKARNVLITLEHYGAQLSGIAHLRQLSPDYVKLDGRYIRDIDTHTDNQLFVRSLLSIAHGLNIKVIAEMVETSSESDWLRDAGVDYQQGYHLGAPILLEHSN